MTRKFLSYQKIYDRSFLFLDNLKRSGELILRKIASILESKPTIEGAGVRLRRVFGFHNVPKFDPFLLLDHFGSDNPNDYIRGFPWHPHRGIETVTYIIRGRVEHGDSIGNSGVINSGDVQWMTAGSGIIHQEMPRPFKGNMMGFQLWVNLPREKKMTEPRYYGLTKNDFGNIELKGTRIIVIAGIFQGIEGPVKDLFVDTEYFDVHMDGEFNYSTEKRTCFIFVYEGFVKINNDGLKAGNGALLEEEGDIQINGKGNFIFLAGNPLKEPIAWGGPIVMNTQKELDIAFLELRNGSFIKGKIPDIAKDDLYHY
jgi:redox-sensitive bicupin YhaK (pirin superfamily)